MRSRVWYGERLQIETIWVATVLAPAEIEQSAVRLRRWALVRDAIMIGSPFLSVSPACDPRVSLPLGKRLVPRADTGISPETLPAGPIAVVRDVSFHSLLEHVQRLADWLEPYGAFRAHAEYQGAFNGRGLLTLPLESLPEDPPAEIVAEGRAHFASHPAVIEAGEPLQNHQNGRRNGPLFAPQADRVVR